MKLKIKCNCGATFTINNNFAHRYDEFYCPNCDTVLPSGIRIDINNFFKSYENINKKLNSEGFSLKSIKMPKDQDNSEQ